MIVARSVITGAFVGVIVLTAAFTRVMHASSRAPAGSSACASSEYHQFDFFEGDWDAYDVGTPDSVVAHNTVTPMLGGCAVREVYVQNDGVQGESFSAFDATRHRWHQSWITNHGSMLLLDGRPVRGSVAAGDPLPRALPAIDIDRAPAHRVSGVGRDGHRLAES